MTLDELNGAGAGQTHLGLKFTLLLLRTQCNTLITSYYPITGLSGIIEYEVLLHLEYEVLLHLSNGLIEEFLTPLGHNFDYQTESKYYLGDIFVCHLPDFKFSVCLIIVSREFVTDKNGAVSNIY